MRQREEIRVKLDGISKFSHGSVSNADGVLIKNRWHTMKDHYALTFTERNEPSNSVCSSWFHCRITPECCTERVQQESSAIYAKISRQSLWKQCGKMWRLCQFIRGGNPVLSAAILLPSANYWNGLKTKVPVCGECVNTVSWKQRNTHGARKISEKYCSAFMVEVKICGTVIAIILAPEQ